MRVRRERGRERGREGEEGGKHKCFFMCILCVCVLQVISGHLGWVRCVAVDPSNEWFTTGSNDRTIKVRDCLYMHACHVCMLGANVSLCPSI